MSILTCKRITGTGIEGNVEGLLWCMGLDSYYSAIVWHGAFNKRNYYYYVILLELCITF